MPQSPKSSSKQDFATSPSQFQSSETQHSTCLKSWGVASRLTAAAKESRIHTYWKPAGADHYSSSPFNKLADRKLPTKLCMPWCIAQNSFQRPGEASWYQFLRVWVYTRVKLERKQRRKGQSRIWSQQNPRPARTGR